MEIINYSDASFSSGSRSLKFSFSQIIKNKASEKFVFEDGLSAKNIALDVKGALSIGIKKAKVLLKFFWIIPCVVAISFIPTLVTGIMDSIEAGRKAGTVVFEKTIDEDYKFMEGLMSDFAMEQNITFDEFGFVVSDGQTSVSKFVNEPVTFQTYTVKSGDTISGITYRFGLTNISTLIAVNDIENVRTLRAGQKLSIPSMDGLYHKVAAGDTLESIATKYNASLMDILDVNDLASDTIKAGDMVFIPGARMNTEALKKAMGETFMWPLSNYRITSYFGKRADPFTGVESSHSGIDLASPTGTQIRSAMSGTVSFAGYNSLYGYYVIINHYNGYQTLYGHMSKIIAKKGQVVNQDTVIGLVGNTGYSTGPHLHFTVYKDGKQVDPLSVLK